MNQDGSFIVSAQRLDHRDALRLWKAGPSTEFPDCALGIWGPEPPNACSLIKNTDNHVVGIDR